MLRTLTLAAAWLLFFSCAYFIVLVYCVSVQS